MEEKDNKETSSNPPQDSSKEGAPQPAQENVVPSAKTAEEIERGLPDPPLLLEYPGFESTPEVRVFGPARPGESMGSYKPWNYYNNKSDTGFVGLSNQGATCYMNSLLQTLFMTPEFRRALYQWEYVEEREGPKEDSIPYQLQQLFGYLQMSTRAAVETKGLTKSFGWSMRDAFEQHDIQELNRVLFDALEKSFKGTDLSNIINELYQGSMIDRILCKECGGSTSRDDLFLDIPLFIRNISSVEEALEKFIEDETLDGDNKVFCEKCNKKCDALKGFKFQEFPYLLTLQLKRFDIDFESENFDRIKLNNKVAFPRYLDMSRFLLNKPNPQSTETSTNTADQTPTETVTVTPVEQSPTALQAVIADNSESKKEDEEIAQLLSDTNEVDDTVVTNFDPNSDKYSIQPDTTEATLATPESTEVQLDFTDDDDDDDQDDDDDDFDGEEVNAIDPENFNTIQELLKFVKFYKRNKKRGVKIDVTTAAARYLAHARANSPSTSSSSNNSNTSNSSSSSSYSVNSSVEVFEPEDSVENIPKGDYIYELYSILIHQGSAQGGHYFAYIKSFNTRKWYKFNDSEVTLLKKGEIENSFGGNKNAWGSSTNAYMLVYRRINKDKNLVAVSNEDVPAYLNQQITTENDVFEQERVIERQKKDKIHVNVFWEQKSKSIPTDRSHTLGELTKLAYETFELDKRGDDSTAIKLENARLRAYDSHRNLPNDDYANQTEKTLREHGINDHTTLLLETRADGTDWPKWSKFETTIHVHPYNVEKGEHDPPMVFGYERHITLKEFKEQLAKVLPGYTASTMRVFEVTMHISELLGENNKMYSDLRIITGDKIYVEPESKELLPTGEFLSPTKEWFKKTKDTITVKFNLPGSTDYSQSVVIDQKSTLREFKKMIEPIVGLTSDEFKVKRTNYASTEFKELDRTLYNLSINGSVLIEAGTPLRRDQHVFKLIKYDNETCKFEPAGDIVVEETMKNETIINNISEKFNLDPTFVRLREKIGVRVTKIYKRNMTVKESVPCCYDGRELVYEVLKEIREIKDDENLVLIARYYPKQNKLSDYTEVIFKSNITLWDFQLLIKEMTDIPLENISIAKPFTTFNLLTSDTKTLSWKKHTPEPEALLNLKDYRWYVSDGDLFFYKDFSEDPPVEEIKYSMDGGEVKILSTSGIPVDFFKPVVVQRPRREEKALKIKTRYDAAEEKEREERKKNEQKTESTNNNNNNTETTEQTNAEQTTSNGTENTSASDNATDNAPSSN